MYWGDGGLREANVGFCNVVRRLMLRDLDARAHVALAVEEEGEGARQALAGDRRQKRLREPPKAGNKALEPLFASASITPLFSSI